MHWSDPHSTALIVAVAVLLDLLLADPPHWPHPVRWIGTAIDRYERAVRPRLRTDTGLKAAGVALAAGLPLLVYTMVKTALWLAYGLNDWAGFALAVYVAYTCLSLSGLGRAVSRVGAALMAGDLPAARDAVGHIVGRDTAALDAGQIAGAAVESAAENASDGVIAPLFYLAVGGPAAGLAYKAINTADSMVGYKNERYLRFGWAAARLDDLANWIPARITALLLMLAGAVSGGRPARGLNVALRDAGRHPSPNAGWPEAVVAGVLGVALGGAARYGGTLHHRPVLGGEGAAPAPVHVGRAVRLLYIAGGLGALLVIGLSGVTGMGGVG